MVDFGLQGKVSPKKPALFSSLEDSPSTIVHLYCQFTDADELKLLFLFVEKKPFQEIKALKVNHLRK